MIDPSAVIALSPVEWVRLAVGLVLFLGPGYGLLSFYPRRQRFDATQAVVVSAGLSFAFWSALLAWLYMLRIRLTTESAFFVLSAGWGLGLIRAHFWKQQWRERLDRFIRPDASRVVLWGIIFLSVGASLWALRDSLTGLGSDSYHHTLIAQLIAERGGLPGNFEPYAPIATFTYHYGFHGLVAALAWLTGLTPLLLTPIVAQILVAVAALSAAFLAEAVIHSKRAAAISAAVAGLVSVFPAYLVNWGRDTQLTGLAILPIFLGLIWEWIETDQHSSLTLLIGVLAAGVMFAHYRVMFMAASGAVILLGGMGLRRRMNRRAWGTLLSRMALALGIAGLMSFPWIVHVWNARQVGYGVNLGRPSASFFALERLGVEVLHYPSNAILLSLALVAIGVGWQRREQSIAALSLWAVAMLVLSIPRFASVFMDTISVVIALYIPVSIVIAWLTHWGMDHKAVQPPLRCFVWAALAAISLWGVMAITSIVAPWAAYVGPDDLAALRWIKINTSPSARFMVNTWHWDFLPDLVIGSDAGYWLPLLTGRATVTIPMVYSNERINDPTLVERLVALDRLNGRLTSPEALSLLRREGVTHVYVGQQGGNIRVDDLLLSPDFVLEYQSGSAFVFRIVGAP